MLSVPAPYVSVGVSFHDADADADADANTGSNVSLTTLTYPTTPYSHDEIHPQMAPGSISGQEAVDILNRIELEVIQENLTSYLDVELLFEDPSAYGLDNIEPTWGEVLFDDSELAESVEQYDLWLDELYQIDYESLSEDDRIFYEKLVYDLELDKYLSSYTAFNYMLPVFNSLTGIQCEILFLLEVFSFDTVEDAEKADETFSILMGDQVEPRREFIETNAKYVQNLDV